MEARHWDVPSKAYIICKLYLKKISPFIKEHRNENEVEYLIPVSCIYIVTSLDLPTTFWCSKSRQSP